MSPTHPTGSSLQDAFDPETFRARGHALVDRLTEHLRARLAGEGPVMSPGSPDEVLASWCAPSSSAATHPFTEDGGDDLSAWLDQVLAQSHAIHHPRYVGHQVSAPLPTAALADLVGGLLNNGMAIFEMGPAATAMETSVIDWLISLTGMGTEAGGILTSGGTLGNLTALQTARRVLAPDTPSHELAILAPAVAHYSVERAASVMGLGKDGLVPLEVDDAHRVRPERLQAALDLANARGRRPFAIVGNACSTATGSYDLLEPMADFASKHDLWFHVDGAHGAAALLSDEHRARLRGVERADSLIIDAHKMFLMPALITAVICRDARHGLATFHPEADYLFNEPAEEAWHDVGHRTFECTKRMFGARLHASLQVHGIAPFREHVNTTFALARRFAEMLNAAADFELALEPEANIVCFRLRPSGSTPGPDLDALQARVREAVITSGAFYLVITKLSGEHRGLFLRTTLMNAWTTESDLAALLGALRAASESTS